MIFFSFGRANRLDENNSVVVDKWFLSWIGIGQFYVDRFRVLFVGKAAGRLWLAHDWTCHFCGGSWTADRFVNRWHFI